MPTGAGSMLEGKELDKYFSLLFYYSPRTNPGNFNDIH
jgi:hypothetical protein